ncbi:D-alanyl-D-alanine carboxypeptidase/D-alanyl-D-alanine-endopeptidase [Legionella dresdenensis]|uniref:D-alanyl-D-alanine carboxypeptidase/D-alanyl-D-alanine-endopeptidase n=1 Tax=Legionella dresdenensis TaxID=450200 RepID=A0ABV8CBV5_9GAMM
MVKFIFSLLNFLIVAFPSFAFNSSSLPQKIDTLIEQQLPNAVVGVLIKNLATGDVIYSKNANKLFTPASCTKLFTAAAALYELKPAFRFITRIASHKNNIYLIFTGSPSLSSADLGKLITDWANKSSKTINGNIIIDTTRYQPPDYAGGNSYDDLGWYYAAPTGAAIIDENAETYQVTPAKQPGLPVKFKAKTVNPRLTLINQVVTASKENEKEHCNLNIETKNANTLRLYGCMAASENPVEYKLAVPDVELVIRQLVQKGLKQHGIRLNGKIMAGKAPVEVKEIARIESEPLIKLVSVMLKESDNIYADSLFKQVAYKLTGQGNYKQGIYAIKQVLQHYTQLDFTQLQLSDGMGTRYNLATPGQLVSLLTTIYSQPDMQGMFLTALPQSGISGTLSTRMRNTELAGLVYAKTGSMHDVSSLSGYLLRPGEDPVVFSIVINSINKPLSVARDLEDKILLMVNKNYSKKSEMQL